MTTGFENHTPMLCTVTLEGGDGATKGEIKVQDGMAVRDRLIIWLSVWAKVVGGGEDPVHREVMGYICRREAIFLRNRLNAFIEKGLDQYTEPDLAGER